VILIFILAFVIKFSSPAPKMYEENITERCKDQTNCAFIMNIPEEMKGPIYLYLKHENFYLNHRKIANSVSKGQIAGKGPSVPTLESSCGSKLLNEDMKSATSNINGGSLDGQAIASPCGLYSNLFPVNGKAKAH
jgi:hypothetical protein